MRSMFNKPNTPNKTPLGLSAKLSCCLVLSLALSFFPALVSAADSSTIVLNSGGGTSATDGLKIFIDQNAPRLQVQRQGVRAFFMDSWPESGKLAQLYGGYYLVANQSLYGSNYLAPDSIPFSVVTTTEPSPLLAADGVTQVSTQTLGIPDGLTLTTDWVYTRPNEFMTAKVTLTIPADYKVNASNPVRYYHAYNTIVSGGKACPAFYSDVLNRRLVGVYTPAANNCSGTAFPQNGTTPVIAFRGQFFNSATIQGQGLLFKSIRAQGILGSSITNGPLDLDPGIEYDFTQPGTYTFSYDIVVGVPTTPLRVDHLEVRHEGLAVTKANAASCGATMVKVLACQTSEFPCSEGNIVTDRQINGSLNALGVTFSPRSSFVINPNPPNQPPNLQTPSTKPGIGNITMTATNAGSFALGGSWNPSVGGMSNPKIRCFNTVSGREDCKVVASTSPCDLGGFECIATKQAYNNLQSLPKTRNPLFTQLANADFSFDVVALKTDGNVLTGYVPDKTEKKVLVELFDDAKPSDTCAAYSSPVATQSLVFTTADAGRKNLVFPALQQAYGTLRCRVTDPGDATQKPPVEASTGCSSDTFTVRPQAITSISSTANADDAGVGAAKTPMVKVGVPFALTANTNTPGYNGQPKVKAIPNPVTANSAAIQWAGAPSNGRVADALNGLQAGVGVLSGNFGMADSASGNGASGSFAYDEVGYFQFKINSVYDDTYVDRSKDQANGDCVAASFSNTPDANGRYGCAFGNTENSKHFGRFIPDHFKTAVVQGCVTGNFTYSRQPFLLTVAAQNLTGGTTQNYIGTFAKALTLSAWNKANPAATVADPRGNLSLTSLLAVNFGKDSTGASLAGGGGVAMNNVLYAFVKPETELASLWLRAVDTEGVSSQDTANTGIYEANPQLHSGRVTMTNSFGPEALDLNVYFSAEHWMNGAWAINASDSCTGNTALTMPNPVPTNTVGITSNSNAVSVTLTPRSTPSIATCVIDATPSLSGAGCTSAGTNLLKRFKKGIPNGTSADFAGNFNLWLTAPGAGKRGNLIVTGNVPQWLGTPVSATVNFGVRRTPWIYRQEVY